MAIGKKCDGGNEGLGLGLGFVRRTSSFGRKRIVILSDMDDEGFDSNATPLKKRNCCVDKSAFGFKKSVLEALPQDILIKILCGVEHDDLKSLFHVSKLIRDATLIAKQWHFAYSTPRKVPAFRNLGLGENSSDDSEEVEAPNAPKQCRVPRSRLSKKKLADISVALFASPDKDKDWQRRNLFMEMEMEMETEI